VSLDLAEKMEVWVNGNLMLTKTFFNYYCSTYNTYYQTHNIPSGAVCEDNVNVTLNYHGGTITKNEQITYMDDISSASDINHPETAFECIQSFAIANTRVTDSMVQSWLYQSSQFPAGYKKAMYGTFMTALTTLWLSDKLADEIAPQLNVTWNRNTTTAVMMGVNNNGTAYVHSPDAGMGMGVIGSIGNVYSFRFMSSLMLSDLEQAALGNAGLNGTSTASQIFLGIMHGEHFQVIFDEAAGTATLMLNSNPNLEIIVNMTTGVVKDIVSDGSFQYKGSTASDNAYCYHDQRTDRLTEGLSDFFNSPTGHTVASVGGSMLIALGLVALGPVGWIAGACIIGAGIRMYLVWFWYGR